MKEKADIPIPSKEDKLEPAKGNIGLATLGVENVPDIPSPSKEDKLEPAEWKKQFATWGATLGRKNIADIPILSKEEVLKSIKDMMDEGYKPVPFNEEKFEPVEWSHVLATLDVCTLNHGIQFCDEEGYDIIPIKMVQVLDEPGEKAPVAAQKRKKDMRRRKRQQIFMIS